MIVPKTGDWFQHRNSSIYEIICVAILEMAGRHVQVVVYQNIYKRGEKPWVRPLSLDDKWPGSDKAWLEMLDDGTARFTRLREAASV